MIYSFYFSKSMFDIEMNDMLDIRAFVCNSDMNEFLLGEFRSVL